MKKIKELILEHKLFFTILCVAISLLGLEYIIVNNYVDKKTNPKKNEVSNKASNISQLKDDEKNLLGINNVSTSNISNSNTISNTTSNTTSNNILDSQEDTIDKKISNKNEEKKKELSNENVNKAYLDYEKLTDEEKDKLEVIPSKEIVNLDELDNTNNDEITEVPSKFSLADKITIIGKDQGSYGLCWDFAGTKIAETYMMLNYNKQYNFSEIAMDYLNSEYMYRDRNIHRLHWGDKGTSVLSIAIRLGGLIESKDIKNKYYHIYTKEEYANFLTLPRVPLGNIEFINFPTLKYENGELRDSYSKAASDDLLEKYRENMKKHLMSNSAIGITISSKFTSKDGEKDDIKPEGEYANIPRGLSFYCSLNECDGSDSHVVAIIGWDDNFDRHVFRQVDKDGNVYYPKKNGAFILANSWSDKDYYYISYEDPDIYDSAFGIKKVNAVDETKYMKLNTLSKTFRDNLYKQFDYDVILKFNEEDYISYSKLESLTVLELNGVNLTQKDLDDLKYFKNLRYLDIKNSNLTNLDFLKNIPKLEYLNVSSNNISDISGLTNVPNLKSLNLANNNVTDISVISNFDKLIYVTLDNNKITNYEQVFDNLFEVLFISLENCDISNIKLMDSMTYEAINLSGNPNLNLLDEVETKVLQLNNNNMSNLSVLSKINKDRLKTLSLVNNDIKDITILKSFKNINSINLSGNKNIENINILNDIYTKNEQSSNNDNVITTFFKSGFNHFIKKKEIDNPDISEQNLLFLNDCNISDISVFNDYNVETLSLAHNNITSLDNFNNYNVKKLDLSNNDLSNTNISKMFKYNISELYLSNAGITNISLDENEKITNLEKLDLSNNDIKDISFLNKIDSLYLLSLENNSNISTYPTSFTANFINLANTGLDDSSLDKIQVENLKFVNISNNNITNMSLYLENLYNKIYDKNEELKNKTLEEKDAIKDCDGEKCIPDGGIGDLISNQYLNVELLVSDSVLTIKPFSSYLHVYGDYKLTLPTSSDGTIDLGNYENFDIFKNIWDNEIYELHNIDIDSSKTKLKILGPNAYIKYGNKENSDLTFKYMFN